MKAYLITVAAIVVIMVLVTGTHFGDARTPPRTTIVRTIHNVSYHGMTCTETIDSTGNSYMNDCEVTR
jgi:hypothetical protein